ncbi:P-loop containing nucleoside triphosphate hydrolase protein [Daldinia caldariorum]|uniref:P-loop containing nucleoside triphosphate hydrolase protein n=1 Tax=Daldinia caldariorum TaxID=326644 RepID=UPI0020075A5D|nr:P-loop containing nucleoside triphosphate hydrolase protein [Daldinia caldariorum]KAI1472028.1 P-loop containing nucleoside triphosphate hydrolase protein [Daldinia caldariorum]
MDPSQSEDAPAEFVTGGIPSIRIQEPEVGLAPLPENAGGTNRPDEALIYVPLEEITRPSTANSSVPSTRSGTSSPPSVYSDEEPSLWKSESIQKPVCTSEIHPEDTPESQSTPPSPSASPSASPLPSPTPSPAIQIEDAQGHPHAPPFQQPIPRRERPSSVMRLVNTPEHSRPFNSCPASPDLVDSAPFLRPSTAPLFDHDDKHFRRTPSRAYDEWETRRKWMLVLKNEQDTTKPPEEPTSDDEGSSDDGESSDDDDSLRPDCIAILDELMKLEGLEEVKQMFLDILTKVEICKKQGRDLKKERFNIVFQGNPGTGKTTVARLYAKFLHATGILDSSTVKETTGMEIAAKGARRIKNKIKIMIRNDGGVLFVDEAYLLTAEYMDGLGRRALDIILTEMENNIGKLVVIFVGYKTELEPFFEHNPGLSSRIPYTLNFADFTDWELWKIMHNLIVDQYQGRMVVEKGMKGLYMRIAIRRLSQSRGSRAFGNARAVENLFETISKRQTKRLGEEERRGLRPDHLFLTQADIIGPDPSKSATRCPAWDELQKLIGLDQVKDCVKRTIGMISTNYRRELKERKPLKLSLNQIFVGAPGTGKTTVAKLYGQILADLGYLSRGDVVLKTPADFIGECLGKSEAKTKRVLEATIGKVLVIDEAYMLDAGDPGKEQDKFKTGVIDTLVSMIQGVPGEDRCIILVGYEDKIKTMFRHVNPGLSRRFPIERPFRFENFNVSQLVQILRKKLAESDIESSPDAIKTAEAMFERALMRPNFSNAGEVESCVATANLNYEARISRQPPNLQDSDAVFEPEDFDPDWKRGWQAGELDCRTALEGRVDPDIVAALTTLHKNCIGARSCGINPRDLIPTNFIFKGPPGTGKTITAQQMGKLFYGMGFLSTNEVIECSAGDLLGQYIGHTAPKTSQKLQEAMGRVLFIDEAYRFIGSKYAAEALDELINFLTKPANQGKTIVILAGYTEDMNLLLLTRHILAGLFRDEIVFNHIPPHQCMALLARELSKVSRAFDGQSFLTDPEAEDYKKVQRLFRALQVIPSWSNARDIKHIARKITGRYLASRNDGTSSNERGFLAAEQVIDCMKEMIVQQRGRYQHLGSRNNTQQPLLEPPMGAPDPTLGMANPQLAPPPAGVDTEILTPGAGETRAVDSSIHVDSQYPSLQPVDIATAVDIIRPYDVGTGGDQGHHHHHHHSAGPENGVSIAVWNRLLVAQQAESTRRNHRDARLQHLRRELHEKEEALRHGGNTGSGGGTTGLEATCNGLRKEVMDIEKQMQDEEKIQQALETANKCVYGFPYVRDGNGYRCTGGAHFIPDSVVHANLG